MENKEIKGNRGVRFIFDVLSLMLLRHERLLGTSHDIEVPSRGLFRSGTQERGPSIKISALNQNFQLQASETLNYPFIVIILITLLLKPYLSLHSTNPQNLNSCALLFRRELTLGTVSIFGCVRGVREWGRQLAVKN